MSLVCCIDVSLPYAICLDKCAALMSHCHMSLMCCIDVSLPYVLILFSSLVPLFLFLRFPFAARPEYRIFQEVKDEKEEEGKGRGGGRQGQRAVEIMDALCEEEFKNRVSQVPIRPIS